MEDPIDLGLPFGLDDPWKPPFSIDTASQHDSLFEPLDTSLPPLEALETDGVPQFGLDLIIPELESHKERLEPEAETLETEQRTHVTFEDVDIDPWDLPESLFNENENHRICTWEALEAHDGPKSVRIGLISEAGPAAFDAAINLLPELRNDVGVLPQDYALRALCNLALGRSSTLFQWDPKLKRFQQTLKGASITGISRLCSESLVEDLIAVGDVTAKLRALTERRHSVNLPAASLALRSCVTSILNAIDESISEQLGGIRSVLQLQSLIAVPHRLLSVLDALVEGAKGCKSDESVISSVSDRVYEEVQTQYDLCSVLRALLARVSVPWLERLATDIGFCSHQTALASGYAAEEADGGGLESTTTFIDAENKELIDETREAIKILRSQDEYHLLLEDDEEPFAAVVNPSLDQSHVADVSKRHETLMMSRLRTHYETKNVSRIVNLEETLEVDLWKDELSQQTFFEQTTALMSSQAQWNNASDLLYEEVISLCRAGQDVPETAIFDLAADLSTTPLERIRPLIQTQRRLVSGVLIRRLFRDHNLKKHLELQKSFQLLGHGDFLLRLSTALLSQDSQSAERRRGATLTGEVMGLRLGTTHEERWPPASSELQLTLMGILNETYSKAQKSRGNSRPLPGALSFAIRQLPEAEIDRVLDPNSLYALDFLRLQYTTVPPLDAILTVDSLDRYDGMFRFLLRLMRVVHVATNLHKAPSLHRESQPDMKACRFAEEANHFVSILMSHVMELGINDPWRSFLKSVDGLVAVLAEEDSMDQIGNKTNIGIEGMRQLHDRCLDVIRNRLFLRRKQEKLRKAVEESLNAILKATFALQRNDATVRTVFEANNSVFQRSMKQICELLKKVVEKPLKTLSAAEAEDLEVNKILLSRLNWNDFYS